MVHRPALLGLAFLALATGCVSEGVGDRPSPEVVNALADTRAMDWSVGNWWAYHAEVGNVSFDIALIVHSATPTAFRLGTNVSAGFFGLPWSGNVTSDLNPQIGPDAWELFDFPLADGKEWGHRVLGYDAKTVAHAALLDVPGVGLRPGFQMGSTSFGQTFARYGYVPEVGWFDRLEIIEPTTGQVVLDAQLTSYGTDWDSAYYVEETIREVRIGYPTPPGDLQIEIPAGYLQVRAGLMAESTSGVLDAQLVDEQGHTIAEARVLLKGVASDRVTVRPRATQTWTLSHLGAGNGLVYLDITGLSPTGPLAEPSAPHSPAPSIDLGALLQRTRPAYPQFEQVTSTALPVGS